MTNRVLFAVLFGLVLAGAVFAGYTETAQIQVFDSKYRPIPRAQVYVIYTINSIVGTHQTPIKETDENGMVNITFTNTEYDSATTEKNYKVIASYMNVSAEKSFVVGTDKAPILPIQLQAYVVSVTMKDQFGQPAPGTLVIGGMRKDADGAGNVYALVAEGNYDMTATFLGSTQTFNVDVKEDTGKVFVFKTYNPRIKVVDDKGMPIQAYVTLGNFSAKADKDGIATFPKTANPPETAKIKYNEIVAERPVLFGVEETNLLSIDLTSPIISNVTAVYDKGVVVLSAIVEDPGPYASGFGANTEFIVNYTVGANKRKTYMYPVSSNHFQAELLTLEKTDVVYYTMSVSDKEGNTNKVSGEIKLEGSGAAPGNGSIIPPINPPVVPQDSMPLYIGVGVVALLVIAGAYFYIKKKKEEG